MEIAVNYMAVVACAIAAMVVGYVWYGPLFGKMWAHLSGISMEHMQQGGSKSYAITFAGSLVMAYVLAVTLGIFKLAFGGLELSMALQGGFWLWLGFFATTQLSVVLWEGKSWKLFFLNTSYSLVSVLTMSAIIASWPPAV